MTETLEAMQPQINIDGVPYVMNLKEYESFIKQCEHFMATDADSMLVMTQIISDQLIDSVKDNTKIAELRPQLKFLRELGFFLRALVSPAEYTKPDQHS
jgi:hypothetical protein